MKGMGELKNIQIIILGLCIGLATIISTAILSRGLLQIRKFSNEVISVTGSAEKRILSDSIVWKSNFSRRDSEMTGAFNALKKDLQVVKNYLISHGVKEDEIIVSQIGTTVLYRQNEKGIFTNQIEEYVLNQDIEVRSNDVKKIDNIARQSTELINEGIVFISYAPQYFYTKLAELKHEMLAQATEDARERAKRMAQATGNKVGIMRSARMGIFQITPVSSYDVAWHANNDTTSLEKKVTAVVNVDFAIK